MLKPVLVRERVEKDDSGKECKHEYRCYCGTLFLTFKNFVERGHTKSCGCFRLKKITKHGRARQDTVGRAPEYLSWDTMIQRCTNSCNTNYEYYGGRGIKVCDKWLIFTGFLADMGPRPKGMTLDRIDNNGNYELSNCRWAIKSVQMANRRPYKKRAA